MESERNFIPLQSIHPTIKTKLIKPILSRMHKKDYTSSIKPVSEKSYEWIHRDRAKIKQYFPVHPPNLHKSTFYRLPK